MSKTVGITAEYNPFHKGHKYQIDYCKSLGYEKIAVAMSGSCVQRGEFAFISKFDRAKTAVLNGASLVCEIPYPFSSFSAEGFAKSGIHILKNLSVDAICFGSECADIVILKEIAQYLLSDEYNLKLKYFLQQKIPFASAREKAVMEKFSHSAKIISSSNDILAIEYIKECLKINWDVEFMPLKRKGANYNDFTAKSGIASANYIRSIAENFDFDKCISFVPEETAEILLTDLHQGRYFISDTAFEKAVIYRLKSLCADDFMRLCDCGTELAYSFENALVPCVDFKTLFENLPTKRYTKARLKRIILAAFLNCFDFKGEHPPFIRILAMDKNGEEIIKNASKTSNLPISHSYRILQNINSNCRQIVQKESFATDCQHLFFKYSGESRTDFTTKLFKI